MPKSNILKGFTIVEMLVVMAILGIIMAITLIALNPAEQFAKSRNTKRAAGIESLANAIQQYTTDQRGVLPEGISSNPAQISSAGVDLCDVLTPEYIAALPQDPENNNGERIMPGDCANYDTGFTIQALEEGHFLVVAPLAELDAQISETR